MNYRKIALQLFDELSCIYADNIYMHKDLCIRFPTLADEWEQIIIEYISNMEKPENYNEDEVKERVKSCLKKS